LARFRGIEAESKPGAKQVAPNGSRSLKGFRLKLAGRFGQFPPVGGVDPGSLVESASWLIVSAAR